MRTDERAEPSRAHGRCKPPPQAAQLALALHRRSVRPLFSKPLSRFAAWIVPYIYLLYMRLVWATSLEGSEDFVLNDISSAHDGAIALLWHEEVSTVAFGYQVHRRPWPYTGEPR